MAAMSIPKLTRRASLATLGAAGLGATAHPLAAGAKGKKKGDVNKRCKQQVDPCKAAITQQCGNDPQCLAAGPACCESLKNCAFSDFAVCIIAASPD